MREYLVFQLYGPLSAWGDIAVGETRPSSFVPAKSAVLGMIAAALGLRRPDRTQDALLNRQWEAQHLALAEGYGLAVKLTQPGLPLIDYHTAEVPSSGSGKNRKVFATRWGELAEVSRQKRSGVKFKGTILSHRSYRQDAFAAVALWARQGAPFPLKVLLDRLREPEFVLYLGRKSCPLALPLNPILRSAECFEESLSESSFAQATKDLLSRHRMEETNVMFAWDADAKTRLLAEQTVTKRDNLASRLRWQFAVREERRTQLAFGGPI